MLQNNNEKLQTIFVICCYFQAIYQKQIFPEIWDSVSLVNNFVINVNVVKNICFPSHFFRFSKKKMRIINVDCFEMCCDFFVYSAAYEMRDFVKRAYP